MSFSEKILTKIALFSQKTLKKKKNVFFENISNYKLDISNAICDFTIFPEDFTYNCKSVADKLIEIEKYFTIFNQIIEKLKDSISEKTDKNISSNSFL